MPKHYSSTSTSVVDVLGIGARTVFGETLLPSVLAMRAGLRAFKEHPYLINKSGHNVVMAADRLLDIDTPAEERLISMASAAITEALAPLLGTKKAPTVSIIIGTSNHFERLRKVDFSRLAQGIAQRLEDLCEINEIQILHHGHAAGLEAIHEAQKLLYTTQIDYCVAGGVDSFIDADLIEQLDQQDRISTKSNSWGFVPGEAAGFALLRRAVRLRQGTQILSSAISTEQNVISTDTICTGDGLSRAFSQALSSIDPEEEKIQGIYGDINGERYRSDEFGFTILRSQEWFFDHKNINSPAQTIGDVGAANSLLNIALAAEARKKSKGKNELSLIWSSSDSGKRAALVLFSHKPADSSPRGRI